MNPLFSKLAVGGMELPNRVCFMAHRTNFGEGGRLTDRHIAYYQRRAAGGCGLITVGELSISPNDRPYYSVIETFRPEAVRDFQRLTQAIHQYDSKVFAQLGHHGFQSSGHITRQAVWAPSALADIAFGETGKAMEEEDLDELVACFARAAEKARAGGFDGLQIDLGAESLLRQFLSPISNQRQDAYGGDLENRMRLPLRVLEAVRQAIGPDWPVGLRLCADEKFWGGVTPEESGPMARIFEQTGQVDFIQTDLATYYNLYLRMASMHTPAGFTLELSAQLKQQVSIPVIAGYQIDFPQMAEESLTTGQADAVGFIRALIADPDMVNKHREGKTQSIRFCARDNLACVNRVTQNKAIACVQNTQAGREAALTGSAAPKADPPKKILVVGAGPAGMAAALAAARKGHAVTVYERQDRSGGQVNMARQSAGRGNMAQLTRYLQNALERLEVPVRVGQALDADQVLALRADAVVLATGCHPAGHPYPGEYGPPLVLTVWDVYQDRHPIGDKVLLIDEIGSHITLASAELLAEQGRQVTVLTCDLFVGVGIATLGDLYLTRQRLLQKGAVFQPDVAVERIEGDRVSARNVFSNAPLTYEGYDTIIVAAEFVAEDSLYYQLKGKVRHLHRVGDCVAPRGIAMAIYEGEQAGSRL